MHFFFLHFFCSLVARETSLWLKMFKVQQNLCRNSTEYIPPTPVVFSSTRGLHQSHKELPRNVAHDIPATAPRLGPLLPAMQRLVQQPGHGPAALRRQEAQEERGQSRPAGAAGQDAGRGRDERYAARPEYGWYSLAGSCDELSTHASLFCAFFVSNGFFPQ